MIDYENFQNVCRLLLSNRWIFAKTMPETPHWYTLRKQWGKDSDFVYAVQMIRQHGYQELYYHKEYTAFNINDMKYWTMGAQIEETILINRKYNVVPAIYDRVAAEYDCLFSDAESIAENKALFELIPPGDDVLDIGCGTGLFMEYCTHAPRSYVGIDPSRFMLDKFAAKYDGHGLVCCKFEDYYTSKKFDLIVSLFGVANYMTPDAVYRIPKMLKPGGVAVVMFFKPDYKPLTNIKTGIDIPYNVLHGHGIFENVESVTEVGSHNVFVIRGVE